MRSDTSLPDPATSVASSATSVGALDPIASPYLLLTFIPYYEDEAGEVWLDALWHHDFIEHLRYLPKLVLAAPRRPRSDAPADARRVEVPFARVPLPVMGSTREALRRTPALARALWGAIDGAEIIHSGVAGWPYPIGWVANTIALMRGRKLVIVVESAPWRLTDEAPKAKDRAREAVTEALARFFVRRADLNLFTQPEYRRTLARPSTDHCHVTPATWINEADIVSEGDARASWDEKATRPVEMIFAARLVAAKGVRVLLDALRLLDREGTEVRVTLIGEGPLADECARASTELKRVRVTVREPVPYGAPFFSLVREHHAVLVPNLGDEQPRLLFDAAAQAVCVIGSATDGIRPHVREGETGLLVTPGDARALADVIGRATASPLDLRRYGLAAREEASHFTHRGMHETRWKILRERFVERPATVRR